MTKAKLALTSALFPLALAACGTVPEVPQASQATRPGLSALATNTICSNQTIPTGWVIIEKFSFSAACPSPAVWKAYTISELATAPSTFTACSGQSYPGFAIVTYNQVSSACNDSVVYKSVNITRYSSLPSPALICSGQNVPAGWVLVRYETAAPCQSGVQYPGMTIQRQ
ncbi:hypothetical protein ACFFLM_04305 [Deinococcus oregonensis]|uniref:Lipoprotein n=1 Tax=Deinococcus oregonensis TaxID=1805970 RepID=A0ABV6AUL7_9DEIO